MHRASGIFRAHAIALIALMCMAFQPAAYAESKHPITGILGALNLEVKALIEDLEDPKVQEIQGLQFHTGSLQGRRVVIVTSGMGKVNSAVATSLLIDHFKPDEVLVVGMAGAINSDLKAGDVVVANRVSHHDRGQHTSDGFWSRPSLNPHGKENPAFFPADNHLISIIDRIANRPVDLDELDISWRPIHIHQGVIISGDTFISSSAMRVELRRSFEADAVDMESACVAQVCWQLDVPFLAIRGLSDQADEDAAQDSRALAGIAVMNATHVVKQLLTEIVASQDLDPEAQDND